MYGYIYKTTTLINNHIYIGQHKAEVFDDKYLGSGKNIKRAISKYGRQDFKVELLEACGTQAEMDAKEIKYISEFDSTNPKIGYNISRGGQKRSFAGCKHSEETIQKIKDSIAKSGRAPNITTLGKKIVTNGRTNKMVPIDELDHYLSIGYRLGKTTSGKPAWNKGLTKEDPRVVKNQDDRHKILDGGGSIGCVGLRGESNRRHQKFIEEKLLCLDVERFKQDLSTHGKWWCIAEYHLNQNSFQQICDYYNIKYQRKARELRGPLADNTRQS